MEFVKGVNGHNIKYLCHHRRKRLAGGLAPCLLVEEEHQTPPLVRAGL